MPTSPPSPCTFPGCPKLVRGRGSRCPEHSYEAARPSASLRGYASRRWRRIRELVIERDGGSCQICGRLGRQVAHIRDRRLGGSDDPSNLRLLCDSCHSRETALETKFGKPDSERFVELFRAAAERTRRRGKCEGAAALDTATRPDFPRREIPEFFSEGSGEGSGAGSRASGQRPKGSREGGER